MSRADSPRTATRATSTFNRDGASLRQSLAGHAGGAIANPLMILRFAADPRENVRPRAGATCRNVPFRPTRSTSQIAMVSPRPSRHLGAMDARILAHFEQVDARFQQIDERFDQIDARFERLTGRVEAVGLAIGLLNEKVDGMDRTMSARLSRVDEQISRVDTNVIGMKARVDGLSDDMRQRFRVLLDRLTGIERKRAA